MTEEQFNHYMAGGAFRALFKPAITFDLPPEVLKFRNQEVVIHQNCDVCPIQPGEYLSLNGTEKKYTGQHRFDSLVSQGWMPEEDWEILEILPLSPHTRAEPLPQLMFKFVYDQREDLHDIFGNAADDLQLPYTAYRNFSRPVDY